MADPPPADTPAASTRDRNVIADTLAIDRSGASPADAVAEPSRSAPMPLPTDIIVPWYGIYGADVDTRWLDDVIARHAAVVADGARALEEVRRAEEPPELL